MAKRYRWISCCHEIVEGWLLIGAGLFSRACGQSGVAPAGLSLIALCTSMAALAMVHIRRGGDAGVAANWAIMHWRDIGRPDAVAFLCPWLNNLP
jgi:hypothetical protein